jgi:TRAP transporter TAXI family solute receptor
MDRRHISVALLLFCFFIASAAVSPAAAVSSENPPKGEKLPPYIIMAVNPGGSLLNMVGTAMAKLISEKEPFEVKLRTTSGYMDTLVSEGEVNLAPGVSVESYQSTRGLEQYAGHPQKKVRLICTGSPLIAVFMVKKDAPYQTVADLKGVKVSGKYPGTKPLYWDGVAYLASVGMTWDDLKVVPVGNIVEGVQAFIQGRTDAAVCAAMTGLVQEADATLKGVRFLGMPCDEGSAKKMWAAVPGCYPIHLKAGAALGVDRDMCLMGKDIYILGGLDTSEQVIYEVTKVLWNDIRELDGTHPMFKQWTHDKMLKKDVTIPYHPGAIRFYKEIGKWTPELQETQERLLQELK